MALLPSLAVTAVKMGVGGLGATYLTFPRPKLKGQMIPSLHRVKSRTLKHSALRSQGQCVASSNSQILNQTTEHFAERLKIDLQVILLNASLFLSKKDRSEGRYYAVRSDQERKTSSQ